MPDWYQAVVCQHLGIPRSRKSLVLNILKIQILAFQIRYRHICNELTQHMFSFLTAYVLTTSSHKSTALNVYKQEIFHPVLHSTTQCKLRYASHKIFFLEQLFQFRLFHFSHVLYLNDIFRCPAQRRASLVTGFVLRYVSKLLLLFVVYIVPQGF